MLISEESARRPQRPLSELKANEQRSRARTWIGDHP